MKKKRYYCPVEVTVDSIGGKWKARILWHLSHRTCRYGELKRLIPEITGKMLSQALRELESDGLISRTEYSEKVITVEYDLTDYGKSLTPILQVMSQWGRNHLRQLYEKEQEEGRSESS
ncbi:winged helix-turn-helix transcriptional regulator [Brevibacillus sp. 179-C9.3 HS]|uniref:winged helix-turn-helix transcriptional regulator n=1 Tax=unclassified Brevibacillus TaxID=2684853 RepID=UPI0039A2541C